MYECLRSPSADSDETLVMRGRDLADYADANDTELDDLDEAPSGIVDPYKEAKDVQGDADHGKPSDPPAPAPTTPTSTCPVAKETEMKDPPSVPTGDQANAKGDKAPTPHKVRVHRNASARWHEKWIRKGVPRDPSSEGSGKKAPRASAKSTAKKTTGKSTKEKKTNNLNASAQKKNGKKEENQQEGDGEEQREET